MKSIKYVMYDEEHCMYEEEHCNPVKIKDVEKKWTDIDMQSFWIWANANGYYYSELNECWLNEDNETDFATEYTIDEVIDIWKEKQK